MKLKKLALIFGILAILYIATVQVSESNFGCGACHKNQHERWFQGTHKKVNCRDCHIDPGMTGAVKAQIDGIPHVFITLIRGSEIPPHEEPLPISTENCMSCHAAIYLVTELGWEDLPNNSLKVQGLKIGHRIHVEKYKMDCVECHRGVVHRDPETIGKYTKNFPFMHTDCKSCHDGKYHERFEIEVTDLEDRSKCIVCHPYFEPPPEY